jgi:serine/threonine protein kinase
VKFSSFELLKQIGSGSFGKVFEAKLKTTGEIFALKVLQKKSLTAKRGLKYAISEADILKGADHPFIVRLHYTFQTINNLYMCMDYCTRGDLSQYIAEREIVSETETMNIAGQIVLALEYLHSKNIVYRDMKP